MQAFDHSRTYKECRLRNIPHRIRLRGILKEVSVIRRSIETLESCSYADFGCSNGFITAQVARLLGDCIAYGLDHNQLNLALVCRKYPDILVETIDLNEKVGITERFDVVTCFETLEHVGNLETAVLNIVCSLKTNGIGLVVVPIECGGLGLFKCLIKILYRYSLDELRSDNGAARWKDYLSSLIKNERMSKFRSSKRNGWGTHFGFDYRDVEDALSKAGCSWNRKRIGLSMSYTIRT